MRFDLIEKHKHLLDMLVWEDEDNYFGDLVRAVRCPFNPGIPETDGYIKAYIHVTDILAPVVNKQNILRLLATIIEAIFTACDCPNIEVC
jgi:hypothetical protein